MDSRRPLPGSVPQAHRRAQFKIAELHDQVNTLSLPSSINYPGMVYRETVLPPEERVKATDLSSSSKEDLVKPKGQASFWHCVSIACSGNYYSETTIIYDRDVSDSFTRVRSQDSTGIGIYDRSSDLKSLLEQASNQKSRPDLGTITLPNGELILIGQYIKMLDINIYIINKINGQLLIPDVPIYLEDDENERPAIILLYDRPYFKVVGHQYILSKFKLSYPIIQTYFEPDHPLVLLLKDYLFE